MTRFADLQILAIKYFSKHLEEPVSTKVRATRPDVFVTVSVTGGSRANVLFDRPTLTLEAWHRTEWEARELAGKCRELADNASHDDGFFTNDYDSGTPVSLPDESGQPRSTFTVEINVPGEG